MQTAGALRSFQTNKPNCLFVIVVQKSNLGVYLSLHANKLIVKSAIIT